MKKYFLGITAVLLAAGFSAFTKPTSKIPKVTNGELWFHFVGDASSPTDLANPDLYERDGDGTTPTKCPEDQVNYRCEILIAPQPGGTKPDLANYSPIAAIKRDAAVEE